MALAVAAAAMEKKDVSGGPEARPGRLTLAMQTGRPYYQPQEMKRFNHRHGLQGGNWWENLNGGSQPDEAGTNIG